MICCGPRCVLRKTGFVETTGYFRWIELLQLRDDYGFATDTPGSATRATRGTMSGNRRPGAAERTRREKQDLLRSPACPPRNRLSRHNRLLSTGRSYSSFAMTTVSLQTYRTPQRDARDGFGFRGPGMKNRTCCGALRPHRGSATRATRGTMSGIRRRGSRSGSGVRKPRSVAEPGMSSAKPALLKQPATFD